MPRRWMSAGSRQRFYSNRPPAHLKATAMTCSLPPWNGCARNTKTRSSSISFLLAVGRKFAPRKLACQEVVLRRLLPCGQPQIAEHLPALDHLAHEKTFALVPRFAFAGKLAGLLQLVKRLDQFLLRKNIIQHAVKSVLRRIRERNQLRRMDEILQLAHLGDADLVEITAVNPRVELCLGRVTVRI